MQVIWARCPRHPPGRMAEPALQPQRGAERAAEAGNDGGRLGAVGVAPRDQRGGGYAVDQPLVPQGSLAEKIRAGGYGLGGILTPTGLGTPVGVGSEDAKGGEKESIVIDGKEFLLERPLRADIAFIYGSVADKYGNVKIHGTARNFNTVMATAADTVICQADELVEMIDPDEVLIQGVLVDYIVGGKN